ncbi:hypothetical protein PPTG_25055, partial [Phytophthora nicotianae INRA-310]
MTSVFPNESHRGSGYEPKSGNPVGRLSVRAENADSDVMLSNAVEVYSGLVREHAERKRTTRAKPELRDATARLENAELIADNMSGADRRCSDQRGGSQGLGSREVYNVTEHNNGDRQARRRAGRGISRPRSPSLSSTRSKKKKKKSVCFRCGSDKHFVRDCPQPAVLGVEKTKTVSKSAAMGLLHNRLNHAGMEEINRVAHQFKVGLKPRETHQTAGAYCCRRVHDELKGQVDDLADISLQIVQQAEQLPVDTVDTAAVPSPTVQATKKSKSDKGRLKRKRAASATDSEKEVPFVVRKPTVAPVKVLPRRKRARPSRLRDFVFNVVVRGAGAVQLPQNYRQAKASREWPEWRKAIQEELASLKKHRTWRLMPRACAGKAKVITYRWVFAIKRDEHGNIKRYKARLVIHGHKQMYGVNFHETYAPVIRFETIRASIYYGVQRGWTAMQFDVKTFLYGPLQETIYMVRPDGLEEGDDDDVCHLLKSLYGL